MRCWPVSVLRSACFARNSATSASTAWVSSARAPLRRISVRESVKAPGWVSLITLLSDTAYHSFIGEVEALNTTTIRRLTRSRRHQLLAIAHTAAFRCILQPRRNLCRPSVYRDHVEHDSGFSPACSQAKCELGRTVHGSAVCRICKLAKPRRVSWI